MYKIILIVFICLNSLNFAAQKPTYFDNLYDSIKKYEYLDYDLAYFYSRMALQNKDRDFDYKTQISINTIIDSYFQKKNMLDSSFSINKASLRLAYNHKDNELVAYTLNNMAVIYNITGNKESAILIYKKALKMLEDLKDVKQIANTCYNISIPYSDLGMNDSAKYYVDRAFKNYQQINDYSGLASCYDFYGTEAHDNGKYNEAIKYYKLEIVNFKKVNETVSLVTPYQNIASTYLKMNKLADCKMYLDSTMILAVSLGSKKDIYELAEGFSDYYEKIGDYKTANLYLKQYYQGKDTISNDLLKTELSDQKSEFDRENSESQLKIQKLEAEKNLKSKETIKLVLITSIVFFAVVILLFINRSRIKQKSFQQLSTYKNQLLSQKEKIEQNQKEIIDSINYAQRIQSAIMAQEEDIVSYFAESFLIYKPKNIVAGDFYFFEVTDTYVFYAAADCTGHGVPGALVSVVCSNALTRSVKEFGLTDPGKILDKTKELVLETFQKSGKDVKDGMDISLCRFNVSELKNQASVKFNVLWAGANNPLWYYSVKDSKMIEIKADKQPIGYNENPSPFKTHELSLEKNDIIYLFTDGYADQFGGPKSKKYKYKQLEDTLIAINNKNLTTQKDLINEQFTAWKGDLEQVDDILVLAVRL